MKSQAGFVVQGPQGAMELSHNFEKCPEKGILDYGVRVSVFESVSEAKSAIHRSLKYGKQFGLHFGLFEQFVILPIKKAR
jgi:hypothetical protein